MLSGVVIKPHNQLVDERGFFTELMRPDWKDFYQNDNPSQTNLIESYPYIIRAWHKNLQGQINYFTILEGAIKICVFDEKIGELTEIISTRENLQTVRVPAYYWHGFRVISMNPAKILFSTNKIVDSKQTGHQTRPWNDQTIIPRTINNKKEDPRAGKPWNWHHPPHR